jgi:hypothetical protein
MADETYVGTEFTRGTTDMIMADDGTDFSFYSSV